jgi:serine phosphatase RsbU (regulator of sigma subunit)
VIAHHASCDDDPAGILAQMNEELNENIPPGQFVTCCYGVVDLAERKFTFGLAGHQPPFYVEGPSAEGTYLATDPRLALGIINGTEYFEASRELSEGSTLLIYTDGLVDTRSKDGERFGEERLKETVEEAAGGDAKDVKDSIVEALDAHAAGSTSPDDVTFLVLQVRA